MTTPNVDSDLHNSGDMSPADRSSETPKKSLRGAAGGVYIGPILSVASGAKESSLSHATGAAGGGVEDSTGYRASDTYAADGDSGLGDDLSTVRPTGRTMYRGDGVQGGSVVGYPAQRSGQRAAADAGDSLTAGGAAAAFMDKRSTIAGEGGRALGHQGRGTRVLGTTVSTGGTYQGVNQVRIPRPTLGVAENPAAGTTAVYAGAVGGIALDAHANDITGGSNDLAGFEVLVYTRGSDTDEDGGLVAKFSQDSAAAADFTTGITSGVTYAVYTRFVDPDGNLGPLSARGTVTAT